MDANFENGEQDLSHEEGYQLDLPREALETVKTVEIVSEQLTRRVLRMVFARAAQIRNRPHYLLTPEEEEEIAPGLTKWLNDHADIAQFVRETDEKGAIGLFLWAILWRVIQDFRLSRAKEQIEKETFAPEIGFGGVDF